MNQKEKLGYQYARALTFFPNDYKNLSIGK